MATKFKNFFYKDEKLDLVKVIPTVAAGLGLAALGTGAAVGAFAPEEKGLSGMAKAGIAAAVAGVGAIGAVAYRKYKAGQDDSEVDSEDREVSLSDPRRPGMDAKA